MIHNSGNNGYDNVFHNPTTGEVLIDESKNWPPRLSGANPDTGLPKQMSDLWIEHVASRIEVTDPEFAQIILNAKNSMPPKLIKTVSAVKKTGPGRGSIITIKVGG